MLRWAFAFLIFALIAGLLGFGGIAAASAGIAKVRIDRSPHGSVSAFGGA